MNKTKPVGEKEKLLKKRFQKRWNNIKKKTEQIPALKLPDKEKLWGKLLHEYRNGFTCSYCNQPLMIKDSEYPYFKSFSIDHKKSIDLGGTNNLENITICCHRCNIVKSTMTAETFRRMLYSPSPLIEHKQLLDQIFYELFKGRQANKLEREDNRKR